MIRDGPNFRIGLETDLIDFRNIDRGFDQLEGGLLLGVSDVDGELARAIVLQGRSGMVGVFYPANGLVGVGCPGSRGDWLGSLHSIHGQRIMLDGGGKTYEWGCESQGQDCGQSQQKCSSVHDKKVESV